MKDKKIDFSFLHFTDVIVENEVVVAEEASETSCAQPTIPARSKSLRLGRFKGVSNFRSVIYNLGPS